VSGAATRTAVVTVVHGRHRHLRLQQRSLAAGAVRPGDHVVVAMADPTAARWPVDGPAPHVVDVAVPAEGLPLAHARNVGVRTALERGAELVVLLDVDCVASPGMLLAYEEAARRPAARGALLSGPVAYLPPAGPSGYDLRTVHALGTPHPARPAPPPGTVQVARGGHHLFWSLSFAVRSSTWERIGGFDEAYVGYGAEDTDLGQRAAAAGVPMAWVGGARAAHQHHPTQHPPVQHLDAILRNGRIFRERWGWWPMQGWLDAFEERGLVERDTSGDYRAAAHREGPPASMTS
jgi:GT2 family glycosyltransferase